MPTTTVSRILGEFGNYLEEAGKSDSTLRAYVSDARYSFKTIGLGEKDAVVEDDLPQITNRMASALSDTDTGKFATIRRRGASLRSFFAYLERSNYISSSPDLYLPETGLEIPEFSVITEEEFRTLIENIPPEGIYNTRNRAMFTLMMTTGMKVGEVSDLTGENIGRKLVLPRPEGLYLPIDDKTRSELDGYEKAFIEDKKKSPEKQGKPYFRNRFDRGISIRSIRRLFSGELEKAGLPQMETTSLRYAHAKKLQSEGKPVYDIAKALGIHFITTEKVLESLERHPYGNRPDRIAKYESVAA